MGRLPFLLMLKTNKEECIMKQMYFAEQTLDGTFIIVRYDNQMQYLVPLDGQRGLTAEDAITRAKEMNEEYFARFEQAKENHQD